RDARDAQARRRTHDAEYRRRKELVERLLDETGAAEEASNQPLDHRTASAIRMTLHFYVEIGITVDLHEGMSPLEHIATSVRVQVFTPEDRADYDDEVEAGISHAAWLLTTAGEITT